MARHASEVERTSELESRKKCFEMLCFGHDIFNVVMDSQ